MPRALLAALTLAFAGCARPSVPAVVRDEPAAPAPDAAATSPLTLADLPAVSSDGQKVAIAAKVSDGARGADNLALLIVDAATDRVVTRVVIVDPSEPQRSGRDQREAEALKLLAGERWESLVPLTLRADPAAPLRAPAMGPAVRAPLAEAAAVAATYREPVLSVRAGDRETVIREVRSWSAAAPAISGTIHCAPPLAQLAAAHASAALGVIVVKVEYIGGTDLCWEPPETWHVAKFAAGGISR
jgi:hypothetical protein